MTLGAVGTNLLADTLDLEQLDPPRHEQQRNGSGDAKPQKA